MFIHTVFHCFTEKIQQAIFNKNADLKLKYERKNVRKHPYEWRNKDKSGMANYNEISNFSHFKSSSEDPPSNPVIPGAYLSGYSGKFTIVLYRITIPVEFTAMTSGRIFGFRIF